MSRLKDTEFRVWVDLEALDEQGFARYIDPCYRVAKFKNLEDAKRFLEVLCTLAEYLVNSGKA